MCFDPLDPDKHPSTIVNIVNGQIAAESVNVDGAVKIGTQAMKQYESKWPEGFNEKISKVVELMTESKKHVKVGDLKVFDTNLIYNRVVGLQASSRDIDILRLLSHELAPVPTSMFTDSGDMRICTAKSVLKKLLQSEVSIRNIEKEITCTVIDGSAVLYVIHWPAAGTLKDYIDNMKDYLGKLLQKRDVFLVFDRYKAYSTKSVTRSGRSTQAARVHSLNQAMPLPPQKVVLTVTENKQQLIRIICEELERDQEFLQRYTSDHKLLITGDKDIPVELNKGIVIQRADMKTTHEEADNIIVQQMVAAANENQKGISVLSDNTDVFVLLLHH